MFSYDPTLATIVQTPVHSIADVLESMQEIDATCVDGDGLKWFNWLYFSVTKAVEGRIRGGVADAAWLTTLDVQFASFYFNALRNSLSGLSCPGCWQVLFNGRDRPRVARIQFALAGINAHINHDLPQAIVATCEDTATVPLHGTPQYADYTALNATLDSLIETAKQTLLVDLLGNALPAVSALEDMLAAWNVQAAREQAWTNAEVLWHLKESAALSAGFINTLDGLTTVAGKSLLVQIA